MTREEVTKLIAVMVNSYPNYKPMDLSTTVDIWTMMLEEYTYQEAAQALKTYILSDMSGFAPAIGQLVGRIHETRRLEKGDELTELEAWSMVYKAICNSTYNAEREFEKLPEIVQKAVGNPANLREWASMDLDAVQSVEQSHFIRVYRAEVEKSKRIDVMPSEVRMRIESGKRKESASICDKTMN
jgi:hypothetical protein